MRSTKEKADLCRALHAGAEPTLSAACWDVGTACLLAHVGVPLIDTTSFGAMATRGLPDAVGLATRDFMLGNARLIAAAVDLLETGATGIVGGSIEDATGRPADPVYPLELAKERIHAAAEAARALPFPFMLTARADQYLWGRPDLAEVIRRAQAFEAAGANAIMVPGLSDLVASRSLCNAVSLPVVVLIGAGPGGPDRERLAATGAKRRPIGPGRHHSSGAMRPNGWRRVRKLPPPNRAEGIRFFRAEFARYWMEKAAWASWTAASPL